LFKNNLARKSNSWQEYDEEIAFGIFMIEKEFHVGMVDEHFPLLKFWNLFDETNAKKYEKTMKRATKSDGDDTW
jgi:hypothetical protein